MLRAPGPGLLESAYEHCLACELRQRALRAECQTVLPIVYERHRIEAGYRVGMLVEGCVVIENKVAEQTLPIHEAQRLSSIMKLHGGRVGCWLNWNVKLTKGSIKRGVL
ncbi:MAG: GxxExxY protein [Blastocatellia bacterium]|nr:GxxExxY protein [Blastocatellia bacterium]